MKDIAYEGSSGAVIALHIGWHLAERRPKAWTDRIHSVHRVDSQYASEGFLSTRHSLCGQKQSGPDSQWSADLP